MAAVPWRENVLKQVVESLLPQVDQLNIYLNDWEKIPDFLSSSKVNAVQSQNEIGDLGDRGKFYWCNQIRGIHLTVDDDILYPPNYVDSILEGMNRNQGAAVTFHGSILKSQSFSEKKTISHFARDSSNDLSVTIGGTGVMAYNTKDVTINFESFKCNYWADGWFAFQTRNEGIPIISLRHAKDWLIPLPTSGPDIWDLNKQEERSLVINQWIVEYNLWDDE